MRIASFVFAGLAVGAALSFAPSDAFAQSRGAGRAPVVSTPLFDVTPYAGYMVFGDFASGPLGTSLSNAPAPIFGAQARDADRTRCVDDRQPCCCPRSDIKAGIPILGGLSVAHNAMVFYDAGLQARHSGDVGVRGDVLAVRSSRDRRNALRHQSVARVDFCDQPCLQCRRGCRHRDGQQHGAAMLMVKDYIGKSSTFRRRRRSTSTPERRTMWR